MPDIGYRYLDVRVENGVVVMAITPQELHSTQQDIIEDLRAEMLKAAGKAAAGKVVVDLSGVELLGSASIRPLLSLRRKLHDSRGELFLCGLQPPVRETFLETCLIDQDGSPNAPFMAAEDVPAALARLGK